MVPVWHDMRRGLDLWATNMGRAGSVFEISEVRALRYVYPKATGGELGTNCIGRSAWLCEPFRPDDKWRALT